MRQLLPTPADDVEPADLFAADIRVPHDDRPWVLVNMVASADGATAVAGVSGPLGGAADRLVFAAIRALADVVLVAAGTVRAERYGPPRPPQGRAGAHRAGRGQAPAPRLAVVTASGDLDPDLRLFAEADPANRPLVVTCEACPPDRRAALGRVADVVVAGGALVELPTTLRLLRSSFGASVVLSEGGPSLNGQLLDDGLVDEWNLTLAAALVGGRSPRPAVGDTAVLRPMRLDRLLEEDGTCFARYVPR